MKTTSEYITLLRKYMAENASKYGIMDIVRLREDMDGILKQNIIEEGVYA